MREQLLCSKIKLEKKIEENERLTNELTEMKGKSERLEQEKQRFQMQVEHDQMKVRLCCFFFSFTSLHLSR